MAVAQRTSEQKGDFELNCWFASQFLISSLINSLFIAYLKLKTHFLFAKHRKYMCICECMYMSVSIHIHTTECSKDKDKHTQNKDTLR